MTEYRRFHQPGATWFFTVNLAERRGNRLLTDRIERLRAAFIHVKAGHPFEIDAVAVLPPLALYSDATGWGLIKAYFSRDLDKSERISTSRRERGVWQSFRVPLTPLAYIHVGTGDFGNTRYATNAITKTTSIISITLRLNTNG